MENRKVTPKKQLSEKEATERNIERYMILVKALDPDLYMIKLALTETQVNPEVIPRIIRSIANLYYGTGYGRVQIFMSKGEITAIKPEESDTINLQAVLEEENQV